VPNPNLTIRNFCIAVCGGPAAAAASGDALLVMGSVALGPLATGVATAVAALLLLGACCIGWRTRVRTAPSVAAMNDAEVRAQQSSCTARAQGCRSHLLKFLILTFDSALWSDGPEVALNWLFPYPLITPLPGHTALQLHRGSPLQVHTCSSLQVRAR
jgi:hypothetical protein